MLDGGDRWAAAANAVHPEKLMLNCLQCGRWFAQITIGHVVPEVTMHEAEFQYQQHLKTDHRGE